MRSKILWSSLAIAGAAALVGGGTYAAYLDTEASDGTTVTAGILDLEVGGSAVGHDFSVANAAPGDTSGGGKGYKLTNSGTIDGELRVFLVKDSDDENSIHEPETEDGDTTADDGELDEWVKIQVDGNTFGPPASGALVHWVGMHNLAEGARVDITDKIWVAGVAPKLLGAGESYPGGAVELWFSWTIDEDADNTIMSDSLGFHLEFELAQA